MGRPLVTLLDTEAGKYLCASCGKEIASTAAVVWEGWMGQRPRVPGLLIKSTVNVVESPVKREEHLTSGCYTLTDTSCGGCQAPLGWRYLTAHEKHNKDKEGGTLIKADSLTRMSAICPDPPRIPRRHLECSSKP